MEEKLDRIRSELGPFRTSYQGRIVSEEPYRTLLENSSGRDAVLVEDGEIYRGKIAVNGWKVFLNTVGHNKAIESGVLMVYD